MSRDDLCLSPWQARWAQEGRHRPIESRAVAMFRQAEFRQSVPELELPPSLPRTARPTSARPIAAAPAPAPGAAPKELARRQERAGVPSASVVSVGRHQYAMPLASAYSGKSGSGLGPGATTCAIPGPARHVMSPAVKNNFFMVLTSPICILPAGQAYTFSGGCAIGVFTRRKPRTPGRPCAGPRAAPAPARRGPDTPAQSA